MRQFFYPFLSAIAAGMLVLSIPAVADHVTEPTHPITKLTVVHYWYSHSEFEPMVASSDPTLQTRCDGSVVTDFNSLRVEPKVVALHADGSSLRGDPSEHWRLNYRVRLFDRAPGGRLINGRQFWGGFWGHQNIPPHGAKASTSGWEAAQTNVGVGAFPGVWLFEYTVIGDESGATFSATCQFDSVAPPVPTTTTTQETTTTLAP